MVSHNDILFGRQEGEDAARAAADGGFDAVHAARQNACPFRDPDMAAAWLRGFNYVCDYELG